MINIPSIIKRPSTSLPSALSSAQTFATNAVQQAKGLSAPGTQAQMAMDTTAPQKQVQGLSSRLNDYTSWSKGLTAQNFAQRQARKAAEATAVQLKKTPNTTTQSQPAVVSTSQFAPLKGVSPVRQKIVDTALSYVSNKTMYAWGGGGAGVRVSRGTGKGTQNVIGVDCSGLVAYAYSQIGMKLPHYSGSQTAMGYRTSIQNAVPGDIVGWNKGGHVAVYVGNGQIAEAPGVGKAARVRSIRPGEAVYAVRLKLQGE